MTTERRAEKSREPRHRPESDVTAYRRSRLASTSRVLRRNQDLLNNAGSLAATTGITSVLGFAYWIYAARVFSTEAVGYGTAAVSTMLLLGTLGMFGLDTMLIGELPRGGNRGGLIMASCIVAFILSATLGLAWALMSMFYGSHFIEINGTLTRIVTFSFGVGITGAAFVFDTATIGLMRGGLQLSRNVAASVAKMAALPAAAFILHDRFGMGINLAWIVGTVVSAIPVIVAIKRRGSKVFYRPDWKLLWGLRKLALAHNWLNLAINIPAKLIPVLVVMVVSPSENGAYYIATMISSFLSMVPQSLSTVLFAIVASAPDKIAEKLRFVLRVSLTIGVPGGIVMGLCSHLILSVFGSSYANVAAGPLWLLIAGYVPSLFSITYIAVARAKGYFNQAAIFLSLFAVLRMAALLIGGKIGGLYGLSYAMLAVQLVQSAIIIPTVLKTAFGHAETHSAIVSSSGSEAVPAQTDPMGAEADSQRAGSKHGQSALIRAMAVTRADFATIGKGQISTRHEDDFRSLQETGMAALIAIARNVAKY